MLQPLVKAPKRHLQRLGNWVHNEEDEKLLTAVPQLPDFNRVIRSPIEPMPP